MSDNTLEVGQVRVGWLYPGEVEEGKPTPATLVRDGHRVQALIPVEGRYSSSPAARWGTEGIFYSDDPNRTKYQYNVPNNMYFIDDRGLVLLADCRISGYREKMFNIFRSLGGVLQKVSVGAAIFSSRKYNTNCFNGYRTEIENLSQWFQMSTLKTCLTYKNIDGLPHVNSVEAKAMSAGEILLDEASGMKFKSNLTVIPNNSSTRVVYESRDCLEMYCNKEISFDDAMKYHDVIRDLMMVSSWSVHKFISISVSHEDDTGDLDAKAWRNVIAEKWETTRNIDVDNKEFVFTYNDIGAEGVRKWLEISEKYPRALNPILATIRWGNGVVENELFNLCSGVEALGRYIAVDFPEESFTDKGRAYLKGAMQNIINQISEGILPYVRKDEGDMNGKVLHNLPEWPDKINNAYNSVKHYGGEEINYDAVFEAIDMLKIIIVSWIGARLGVEPGVLRNRLIGKNYEFEKYLPPLDDAGYVIEERGPEQESEPAE